MPRKDKPKIQLEDFAKMLDFEEDKSKSGIVEMAFSKMKPFPNHKFKLYEDERLDDMVESIKALGILMPIILWHTENDEYIILSGHNRKNGGEKAGLLKASVIIKEDLTMDEATLIVTETNLRQRSFADLSHSERAYCLAEHYKAMKSQGKRNDLLNEIEMLLNTDEDRVLSTSSEIQTKLRTDEKLGQNYGLSKDKVAKYIRISELEKPIMEMLDNNIIPFGVAYILSFLGDTRQNIISDLVEANNYKIDMKKAGLLRHYFVKSNLSEKQIEQILSGEKEKKPKSITPKPVKVKNTVIKKYFTANESSKEIEETIEKALEMYFRAITKEGEFTANED